MGDKNKPAAVSSPARANASEGAKGALFRSHAPASVWERLNVPAGCSIVGRNVNTGNLNFIPEHMLSMHTLVAGATGSGKSMYLFSNFLQHVLMLDGKLRGGTLIDPHGTLTNLTEERVAAHDLHKERKITILRPGQGQVFGFDVLPDLPGVDPAVVVDAAVGAVATVWHQDLDAMPRLRQALSAVLYAIKVCRLTLLEAIDLMLVEDRSGLRRYVTQKITHPVFRAYFEDLEALPIGKRKEEFESTGRRVSEFLKLDVIRLCFGVRDKAKIIDLGRMMEEGQILVLDLSTGPHLSQAGSKLLGALIVNSLFLHALRRPEGATPHHLFIDEAGHYLTEDATNILDQARKFGLHFTLAVQTLAQIKQRGEALYRSVMTNTRNKVIFGGLDDEDATTLARTCWRGQFDLERSKSSYEKFVPVGEELVWLQNESQGEGTSRSAGRTWSVSEGTAHNRGTTDSRSTTYSEGAVESESETLSESITESESTTRSHSTTISESTTETESTAETAGSSDTTFAGESEGESESYNYAEPALPYLPGQEVGSSEGESSGSSKGKAHADSSSLTAGRSLSRTQGTAVTDGIAETRGSAHTAGQATTKGTALSKGVAQAQGLAITRGTTVSHSSALGGSTSDATSHQSSTGRAQTYHLLYRRAPTTPYSLEELVHLASVAIANLPTATCLLKVGSRKVSRVKTLPVRRRVVSDEHLARVRREMAAQTPFALSREEAQALYDTFRAELLVELERRDGDDE